MDYRLEPPEPRMTKEETREVACTNDDCQMFEEYIEELVEVDYWSDHEGRFVWQCDFCLMENEVDFDPMSEVDWDMYFDAEREANV